MRRKVLKIVLLAACTVTLAGALAACRPTPRKESDLAAEGFTCNVVLDLAGGTSGDGDRARTELHQYAKSGSVIVAPGAHLYSGAVPMKAGYTLGGYYRGEKDENGNITYGEKWDFTKDKVTGDLTLYAKWLENYTLVVHYGDNFAVRAEVPVSQSEDGVAGSVARPNLPNYTPIAFYTDRAGAEAKDGSKAVTFPHTPTELTAETPVWEVWADALEGSYQIVRTASEFTFASGRNVYLMNDIDFGGQEIAMPEDYSAHFCGNGHTLSNFTIKRTAALRGNDNLGLFKRLVGSAYVENVTFSEFTLEVESTNAGFEYRVGALAGYAQAGVRLRNVTLAGTVNCKLVGGVDVEPFVGGYDAGFTEEGCHYEGVIITGYDPS